MGGFPEGTTAAEAAQFDSWRKTVEKLTPNSAVSMLYSRMKLANEECPEINSVELEKIGRNLGLTRSETYSALAELESKGLVKENNGLYDIVFYQKEEEKCK